MIEGIYRIVFTGTAGSGFGMLAFHSGVISGADVAGAIYDGSYTENARGQAVDFQVTMNAPAGVTPVQIGTPLAAPLSLPISGSLPMADVEDGNTPILLQTPIGPVNVVFKKIRDFP